MIVYKGYIYNMHKTMCDGTIKWRCQLRTCCGSMQTRNGITFGEPVTHNHDSSKSKSEAIIARYEIKQKTINTNDSAFEILSSSVRNYDDATIAKLPKIVSLKDNIKKIRNKTNNTIVQAMQDIPEVLCKTLDNKRFLLYDSGVGSKERFIIFASENSLLLLKKLKVWQSDGTFHVCPRQFYQLYVIHGFVLGTTIPLVYVLMSSKTMECYVAIFKILHSFGCQPTDLIVDFELAVVLAFESVFVNSKGCGCLFHLGQSVWRKVQNLGKATLYKNSRSFCKAINMVLCLSFVPVAEVITHISTIENFVEKENLLEDFNEFLNYFKSTYLGSEKCNGEFMNVKGIGVSFWNVYDRVLRKVPLTNNGVEAWNNSIKVKCEVAHPNIGRFINLLQKEEELTRIKLIKCRHGEMIHEQKEKNAKKEKRLFDVVANYDFIEKEEYLSIVCELYHFKFRDKK